LSYASEQVSDLSKTLFFFESKTWKKHISEAQSHQVKWDSMSNCIYRGWLIVIFTYLVCFLHIALLDEKINLEQA
jgi:hypothetical protein